MDVGDPRWVPAFVVVYTSVLMAVSMMFAHVLAGNPPTSVPRTGYSEYDDALWDAAVLGGSRHVDGRPVVWFESTLYLCITSWGAEKFRKRFRLPPDLARHVVDGLVEHGVFTDNECQDFIVGTKRQRGRRRRDL